MYPCSGPGDLSEGISDRHDFVGRGVKGSPEEEMGNLSMGRRRMGGGQRGVFQLTVGLRAHAAPQE